MTDVPRIRALFNEAVELAGPERMAYLDHACAADPALRARVDALLAAAEREDGFLAAPTAAGGAAPPPTIGSPLHERPGTVIGRYKLLEQIGEGGFGVVFLAEQREPVTRKVALKIIKLGMDTKQVIARFEAERQALAMMDHPNIAKVLDAGETETGRPYFVMELVRGDPITAYCDRNNVSTKDRLDLFTQVCHAVQHAHQKGVIHRDIKPSNVLITVADGKPIPKVIDFGIAKATASKLTEKTLFTEHRALIGTPAYMSPEQAEMSGVDIDTRSDVYSLGVLLYELLTGTTPFDTKSLMAAGLAEIQRIIREVEPEKPSTRLSQGARVSRLQGVEGKASGGSPPDTSTPGHLDTSLSDAASRHRADPAQLARSIRGDLDWIVMKALEKDRTRRYETANGLAADVARHLAGEPVLAAPPSAAYRARKFVRRHKVGVGAGAAIAGAMLLGIIGTTAGFLNARSQRDRAVEAEREQARLSELEREQRRLADSSALKARGEAERAQRAESAERQRADELKRVSEFQADMLGQVDPTAAGRLLSEDVIARFEEALVQTGVAEADRPAHVDAFRRQWETVNSTDAALALIDRAILEPAVRAIDSQFKDQPVVDAQLRQALADRYRDLGLYEAAEPLQERALATRRLVLGEDHVDTLASITNTGMLLKDQGKLPEAEAYFREALERSRRALGEEHKDTLTAINNLGAYLWAMGRLAEAEPYGRESVEKHRRLLGDEHPDTLATMNGMGSILVAQGKLAEAQPYYRAVLETRRRVLGDDHRDTLTSINNMGYLLQKEERWAEAEPYFREALDKRRRVLGEDHPDTLMAINNLGFQLQAQGKLAEAEPYLREVLEKGRRVLGEDHPATLTFMGNIGGLLHDQGRLTDAEPYYREVLEKRRLKLGPDHPHTLTAISNLGALLNDQRRFDDAERCFREALDAHRRLHPGDHPSVVLDIIDLAVVSAARGRLEEAESLGREAAEMQRRIHPPGSGALCADLIRAGRKLLSAGTPAGAGAAEPLLREALEIARGASPDGHTESWQRFTAMSLLGAALAGQARDASLSQDARLAKLREAEPLVLDGYAGVRDVRRPSGRGGDPTRQAGERIVDLYTTWDTIEPGKGYQKKAEEWRKQVEDGP